VPHFGENAYDNGQIVEYLANLWAMALKSQPLSDRYSLTVQWLKREMTTLQGYFYAAQDVDSVTTPDGRRTLSKKVRFMRVEF
jgi:hypothetical protein